MRKIAVVTVGRTDWSIWLTLLEKIREEPGLDLHLIATGMHLSPEFGATVHFIEQDGFEINDRVEITLSSDTPEGVSKTIGLGVLGFAQIYTKSRPDILLVLGDRYETLSAVVAAMPYKIPVAHIHGGESTEGAIDELIRHAITKMSHLHFATTQFYADRIARMGEERWRVTVSGAPAIDTIKKMHFLSQEEIESKFSVDLKRPLLLVTYHPVTLEYEQTEWQVQNLLEALAMSESQVLFTYPNADTSSRQIIQMIKAFCESSSEASFVINAGHREYFSLMKYASVMVGNSSSGIIEAASFELPVVNIGNRQKARVRGENVIDVGYRKEEILEGIRKSKTPEFKKSLSKMINPYGDGTAGDIIVNTLKNVTIDEKLIMKRFSKD